MNKFTLVSDLHIDINKLDWSIFDNIDINIPLVIAGDVTNDVWGNCNFLVKLKKRIPTIIYTPGNHCFYNSGLGNTRVKKDDAWEAKWPYPRNVDEINDHYLRWCNENDIIFLNRSSCIIDGIKFIGATGWHDFVSGVPFSTEEQMSAYSRFISDGRHIVWNTQPNYLAALNAAQTDAKYISDEVLKDGSSSKVVITHHIPHREFLTFSTDPIWNILNGCFCNTLLENIKDESLKVWCFGHTHFRFDKNIGNTRYVCNPRGYPGEINNWVPVEIEVN